ncbi:uncharacterized protein LOC100820898 [Brachypodium distachyon]|uniref:Uncharacterized protein n=1 Tax=Brachypodium distachyon TaxID=15368 RepID=A0A0Q3FZ27_BRADI|nr:uncharacterized protein LOC100820898 [Brachypodium distachyon]KQK04631.1 hypothetical protein BRADI_2g14780v3 [Brachypodium distachyon]|eukprot:XP_003567806.1 uncharacterized protein LOC100820898 [Brachypodium distachyon]
MVKLATAREARRYGPPLAVRRWEYINAAAYAFATLLLFAALSAAAASSSSLTGFRAGMAAAGVALAVVAAVNLHDLGAHVAGLGGVRRVFALARLDPQLALVELLAPALHSAGCALAIAAGVLALNDNNGDAAAAGLLVGGGGAWVAGSVLNACQVYERADGRAQLLQSAVQVPLLLGSLLFLVSAVAANAMPLLLLPGPEGEKKTMTVVMTCGLCGSALWVVAAVFNAVKVVAAHQSDAPRLERLRGGAEERLAWERDGGPPPLLGWRSPPPAELR